MVNESTSGQLETYLDKSPKIRSKVIPSLMSKQVKEYQDSNDNMCRSLKILYEDGLLAKKKYKSICRNVKATVGQSITNPKLVYYDKLIAFIKSVDVQNVHDFASEFNKDTSKFEEPINGSYRDFCSYIKVLAELYIQVDQALGSESFFQHFGALPYHFRIAIGADGAPFGKDDEATAWLVSFLNVGKHIQSERDNFLVCGANCSENHPSMKQYAKKLMQDIAHIETQSYIISGFNCKFTVELVPSDMKWLSTMSGELNNAAYYFSPFGNVNDDNKQVRNGSLGDDPSCTWHPWNYNERIKVAREVANKKEELCRSKNSNATKRNKLLNFIREQGSRQEYEPLLGKLVDCGFAEPLHNSNNAWAYFHQLMLETALAKSGITGSCKQIEDLPSDSPFSLYITVLKNQLRVGRLVKRIRTWFNEGRKGPFSYRFTGKETRIFCHKFMFVLHALSQATDPPETKLKIASIAFCCLQLRDAISYFSRVDITLAELEQCKKACLYLFNANALLLKSVTPTLWTVGYAIPRHIEILFDRYGMGLGINSMQGREAKHVRLSEFAKHSTKSTRWSMVLRHDYMCNVWIRMHEPGRVLYTTHKHHYIPKEIELETFCYCGFPICKGQQCSICISDVFKAVEETAIAGGLIKEIHRYI